jgi:hypothetical protein
MGPLIPTNELPIDADAGNLGWHPAHGNIRLLWLKDHGTAFRRCRVVPESGQPFVLELNQMGIGTVEANRRMDRALRARTQKNRAWKMTDEEESWTTFWLCSGEVFSFRRAQSTGGTNGK